MKSFDYIIVGQGLAGTILAHDLIDLGYSVLIIDKHKTASATKVAAGLFNPLSMKRCIPTWNVDSFLPYAIKRYRELEEKMNVSFLNEKTILKVFSNQSVAKDWKIKYSNSNVDKYISGFKSPNEVGFLKDNFGSVLVSPAGNIDVTTFLSTSKNYFAYRNSFLNEEFDYKLIDPSQGVYKNIRAKKIIFCEGFRVLENPFFNWLPLRPTKGEVLYIRIPSIKNMNYILSNKVYVLPLGNFCYLVGATYHHKGFNALITEDGKRFLIKHLDEVLDVNYEIMHAKAGVRPTVFDRKPIAGLHPDWNKLAVFNGLGTRGVLISPLLSSKFCLKLTTSNNLTQVAENERIIRLHESKNRLK
ncbi:MAG: NAD(P)/FAD-dependent oxidoreductase [Flavobacteriales bacterium]